MDKDNNLEYLINLEFETVQIPPFKDVLILTNRCPHGVNGICQAMDFISYDDYDVVDYGKDDIETILISKKLIKRISINKIIKVLEKNVFPYILEGDITRVDFEVKYLHKGIRLE